MPKVCVDCKYCRGYFECAKFPPIVDRVTGEKTYLSCKWLRMFFGKCGRSARYFEPETNQGGTKWVEEVIR